ncbi:MAG: hypothetical protein H8E42_03960 [Nitrospinae bacterium]|nr:hypothetical protein [Nitrospinota bacterium]MBL7021639.1 hypothetical protein [Nitrospinaceae bacterium]
MLNRILNRDFTSFTRPASLRKFLEDTTLWEKTRHYLKETGRRHPVLKDQSIPSILRYKSLQIVSAPFIYLCFIPTIAMDIVISLYQGVCFPLYGIPLVKRGDYVIIDRHKLKYLNLSKKINCVYCGYFSGVISYAQEVAGRTEQYWCPVKHATKLKNTHSRYENFSDYGDAKGYRDNFVKIRNEFDDHQPDDKGSRWTRINAEHPAHRRRAG